jgi:hypothetical protein
MKTPFTIEQFFEVFRKYNEAVFPIQILFYLACAFILFEALKPTARTGTVLSMVLASYWLWMGIVYHFTFFTVINKAAYAFGVLFILQGILFISLGVLQDKLSFKLHYDAYGVMGMAFIFYALIVYPLAGYMLGHRYPASPTLGLPCPTTIFTFGLLLLCDKKCPIVLLIIPLIWSLIGLSAAFQFGMLEDIGLPVSGLLTVFLVFIRNRKEKEVFHAIHVK